MKEKEEGRALRTSPRGRPAPARRKAQESFLPASSPFLLALLERAEVEEKRGRAVGEDEGRESRIAYRPERRERARFSHD